MDRTVRVLLTVEFRTGVLAERAVEMVTAHGGRLLGRVNGALVSMLPDLASAATCAERLQERGTWRERIVVSVGPVADVAPPPVGVGVDRAVSLLGNTKAGEIAISALADSRIVRVIDRVTAKAESGPTRGAVLATLQWAMLVAYAAAWFGLIGWRIWVYAETGGYPCWPAFMCG